MAPRERASDRARRLHVLGIDPAAGDSRRHRSYLRLPSLPHAGLHARLSGWESDGCAWAVSSRVRRDRPPPMSWQVLV